MVIDIDSKKYSQGRRIASILYFLITKGSKSFPELKERFPMVSKATLERDIKLLREEGIVVDKKESRLVSTVNARKVFMFFKDDKDIVGKTKKAMENLKEMGYAQVTLDLIASKAGFPPKTLKEAAYSLAPKINLMISTKVFVGGHEE